MWLESMASTDCDMETTFDPLIVDARHNSCTLKGPWMRRAQEDLRYKRTLARLQKQQVKWNYVTDCQCISAFGEDEHDSRSECKVCGKCIADEPMLSDRYDSYDDKPYCISCVMELEELSIEEIAGIFNDRY